MKKSELADIVVDGFQTLWAVHLDLEDLVKYATKFCLATNKEDFSVQTAIELHRKVTEFNRKVHRISAVSELAIDKELPTCERRRDLICALKDLGVAIDTQLSRLCKSKNIDIKEFYGFYVVLDAVLFTTKANIRLLDELKLYEDEGYGDLTEPNTDDMPWYDE